MRRRRIKGAMDDFISFTEYAIADDDQVNHKLTKFADDSSLSVEVGSGRGGFLAKTAARDRHRKFVGIELKEELLIKAVRKAEKRELNNLKFICGYAENIIRWFEQITIDTLYLNFVDPWPKARHAKRRLSHENYLKIYKRFMKPGSRLVLKTDNRLLYLFSLVELAKQFKIVEKTTDLMSLADESNVMTEYEERYSGRGQKIYRIICEYEAGDET